MKESLKEFIIVYAKSILAVLLGLLMSVALIGIFIGVWLLLVLLLNLFLIHSVSTVISLGTVIILFISFVFTVQQYV